MTHPKEIWIVQGRTVDDTQTEWQFSDGPSGNRSGSADYTDLLEGLKDHSGCILHLECQSNYQVTTIYTQTVEAFDEDDALEKAFGGEQTLNRREARKL